MNVRRAVAQWALPCATLAVLAAMSPVHAQSPPDWQGVWIAEGLTADISGFPSFDARPYKLLGMDFPWNEEGRARVEATRSRQADQKADGWGFPLMMDSAAPFEFVITPHQTLIINVYRDVRHVYTDGRDHPAEEDRWPTTWGDSVGRWEGDMLVIDTVSVRNPNRYFFSSPPLSEQARYVERLRMTGPDRIESVMTIEDPVTLERPFAVELVYVRTAGLDRLIHDAYDNDRSEVEDGLFTIVPPKD
jgi:hypothetical protein